MRHRAIWPLCLFLLLLCFAPLCRAAEPGSDTAQKLFLWKVSGPAGTVYLFGTIHLLPDKYNWRTAKFDQAVAGSNELVLETIIDESVVREHWSGSEDVLEAIKRVLNSAESLVGKDLVGKIKKMMG